MGIDMRLLSRRRVVSEEAGADSGEVSLNKLGYKQELSRGFGFVNNAAMSFRYPHKRCSRALAMCINVLCQIKPTRCGRPDR